mgnify:CR=1 FL=1
MFPCRGHRAFSIISPCRLQSQICTCQCGHGRPLVGADDPVRPRHGLPELYALGQIRKILQNIRRGGVLPLPAVRCYKIVCTNANTQDPVGADDHIGPHGTHDRFYETHRRTRWHPTGGQSRPPLQSIIRMRHGAHRFAIAYRGGRGRTPPLRPIKGYGVRADVVIGPYKRFTRLPFIVRICNCALRGRGKPLPCITAKDRRCRDPGTTKCCKSCRNVVDYR